MIEGSIPNKEVVLGKIKQAADRIGSAIETSIKRSSFELATYIQTQKLSGQVVGVVTGRLRNSISPPLFEGAGKNTIGIVSPNNFGGNPITYAKAIEFGFSGTVDVKAHARMMTSAFGKPVKDPRMIAVRSHTMKMNVRERSYMRSSLEENRSKIRNDLFNTIMEVINS